MGFGITRAPAVQLDRAHLRQVQQAFGRVAHHEVRILVRVRNLHDAQAARSTSRGNASGRTASSHAYCAGSTAAGPCSAASRARRSRRSIRRARSLVMPSCGNSTRSGCVRRPSESGTSCTLPCAFAFPWQACVAFPSRRPRCARVLRAPRSSDRGPAAGRDSAAGAGCRCASSRRKPPGSRVRVSSSASFHPARLSGSRSNGLSLRASFFTRSCHSARSSRIEPAADAADVFQALAGLSRPRAARKMCRCRGPADRPRRPPRTPARDGTSP